MNGSVYQLLKSVPAARDNPNNSGPNIFLRSNSDFVRSEVFQFHSLTIPSSSLNTFQISGLISVGRALSGNLVK